VLEKLAVWFAEMASILHQNSYNPADIYNMDETGSAIGATQFKRVIAVLEKEKLARKGAPGRQEWVTSIECVSAAGRALPPLVIFKGGSFKSGWLPAGLEDAVKGWGWASSNTGWTNDTLAFNWLKKVFLTPTVPSTPNQRRLLIVDGHGSHVKARFIAC